MTILVVSNSKFFREAIKLIVQGVDFVESIDSLDKIENPDLVGSYDLVLCDLSCFEDQRSIAEDLKPIKDKGTKVVLFSFDPADRLRDLITDLGADGYIHRPLDPNTVLEVVSRFH